jgi:transposase
VPVKDARSLPPVTQEELRKRCVDAVLSGGMAQRDAAKAFGVHYVTVCKWVNRVRDRGDRGERSLEAQKRGPAKGFGSLLTPQQSQVIRNLIIDKCPEQLKLPFALWTREAIRDLIKTKFGITIAIRTVGDYLKEWGFTPQKPVRQAYEKCPEAVQQWLDETYPAIAKKAKQERALIYWGDEMGLRSDHSVGRSYAPKGETPAIPGTGKRFGCSMVSAVTNQGHLCFRVFTGSFNAKLLIDFFRRLIRQANHQTDSEKDNQPEDLKQRKVYLILDGHPVHRANVVREWVEKHADEIAVFYLPSYSPELNPDELLNQDVKTNVSRHNRPRDVKSMMANLRSYLFSTQKRPDIVKNYFKEKHVKYALPEAVPQAA